MKRFAAGITLLELMIVVAIVAILAAIAIPNYRSYVMRANRSEAMAALLRIASAQEKFYLQANTYASNAQMPGAPPAGLGVPATSDHGWYSLQIAAGAGGLASGYTATATAVAGTVQAGDGDCRTFSVNETGQRTAANSSSVDNTANCWR